jgi:hypothetical protein
MFLWQISHKDLKHTVGQECLPPKFGILVEYGESPDFPVKSKFLSSPFIRPATGLILMVSQFEGRSTEYFAGGVEDVSLVSISAFFGPAQTGEAPGAVGDGNMLLGQSSTKCS